MTSSDHEPQQDLPEHSKSPHTEGLDEAIEILVERIRRGAKRDDGGNWPALELGLTKSESIMQIKALLAETKKPPHKTKELSSADRGTLSIPNIDEVLKPSNSGELNKAIVELLFGLHIRGCEPADPHSNEACNAFKEGVKAQLKSLIESTVLSCIGSNESSKYATTASDQARDLLRAEQRSKLGRLLK